MKKVVAVIVGILLGTSISIDMLVRGMTFTDSILVHVFSITVMGTLVYIYHRFTKEDR